MNLVDVDDRAGATEAAGPVVLGWRPTGRAGRRLTTTAVLVALPVVAGAALRLWSPSPLWLDEAQAVAIARLPVDQLLDALRQDGAPPLYYLVLHGWIRAFGTGAAAVRSLSAVFSLLALPLAWRAGLQLGGRRVAAVATVVVATSPFAIRYATEARMYSLVMALALALVVLLSDPRAPTRRRSVALAAVVSALLLTHYWSFFLVGAVAAVLAWRAVRGRGGAWAPGPQLAALAAGAALFLPWSPSFWFQLHHTGAPWAPAPGLSVVEVALRGFAGGDGDAARVLQLVFLLVVGALVVPLVSARLPAGVVSLTRDPPWPASTLAGVALLALVAGGVATRLSSSGFAPRHAAIAFPPLVLAVAVGLSAIEPDRLRRALVGGAALLGLVVAVPEAGVARTQAAEVAGALARRMAPGDVVVVCPDQLAPALRRALPDTPLSIFPPGSRADRVDWTDYQQRVAGADPRAFARSVNARAGTAAVWLVVWPGYAGAGPACSSLHRELARTRPGRTVVPARAEVFEKAVLWRGPATGVPPAG